VNRFKSWWLDTFTMHRWAVNPFQMYGVSFLAAVAIAQIQLGASPGSVQADLDRNTLIALAICNIGGAGISLYGLHLRELESALWVEFCGYFCLIFVLGMYVWLLSHNQLNPNATYGFAFSEAFVFAAIHRSVQILLYKRARSKRFRLEEQTTAMQETLDSIMPSAPVEGEAL
jgi:hypothetical protein